MNESNLDLISYDVGLPQGSELIGPNVVIFNICQWHSICSFWIWSPSEIICRWYQAILSSDLEELFATANTNMTQLQKWFIANRLSPNLDETCYSIFGHCSDDLSALKLYIDGK